MMTSGLSMLLLVPVLPSKNSKTKYPPMTASVSRRMLNMADVSSKNLGHSHQLVCKYDTMVENSTGGPPLPTAPSTQGVLPHGTSATPLDMLGVESPCRCKPVSPSEPRERSCRIRLQQALASCFTLTIFYPAPSNKTFHSLTSRMGRCVAWIQKARFPSK